ncbi:MAG TPA: hypothetical protein VN706_11765 [Gemmatimonadaceae bacterium]|nr:hypothetical protein [Gemmatimonadaceae bacterium]
MRPIPVLSLAVCVAAGARAQQAPAIRQIGKLEAVSADSAGLASVFSAVGLTGNRILVNDVIARRIVLLDSTLGHAVVVADTTSATADAYGQSLASLIGYRGDSALLIVPSTLSMFVIGPTGNIARTMAIPRARDVAGLKPGRWAAPGIDSRGRLIYLGHASGLPGVISLSGKLQVYADGAPTPIGESLLQQLRTSDTAAVVRADPATRLLDTVAWVKTSNYRRGFRADAQGFVTAMTLTPDALPLIDEWTVLPDGTLAIVRGRDFHVDWVDPAGRVTSSPKIAFDWRRVDDAQKRALIDSVVAHWQGQFDEDARQQSGASGSSGRGRGGAEAIPTIALAESTAELPDYLPPFSDFSIHPDSEGNVWIRTTTVVDGRPVYYVVNRSGALVDRVQLPAFREIAGFGNGVLYMTFEDRTGRVHLERARIH